MKKRLFMLVLVIALLLSQVGYSGAFEWKFFSGNSYNKMTGPHQLVYLVGCFDMLNSWLYLTEGNKDWFEEVYWPKVKNMSFIQIKKIFDKYLEEHPEDLNGPAAILFNLAISEAIGIGVNNGK